MSEIVFLWTGMLHWLQTTVNCNCMLCPKDWHNQSINQCDKCGSPVHFSQAWWQTKPTG